MSTEKKAGLGALLTPEESVLVLIDHQPFQFANLHSHEPAMVVNNAVGLAKAAKAFDVPTILTTVLEERGGLLIQGLQDVFPEQKPINRTLINTWQDEARRRRRQGDRPQEAGRRRALDGDLRGDARDTGRPARATRCTPSPTPPGASRRRPTRWRSGA